MSALVLGYRKCDLAPILVKYRQALANWKSGLSALEGPNPDPNRAKTMFESGDKWRREAVVEFGRMYIQLGDRGQGSRKPN